MIVLKPVDRVEVLSVMDNSIDVLMGTRPLHGGRRVSGIGRQATTQGRTRSVHARDDSCGRKQGYFPFRYRRNH